MDNCGAAKNTQQTIDIDDELLDITFSSFPCSLYLSPVRSLDLSCPPSSYDTNLKYCIMFFIIPFMLNYSPIILATNVEMNLFLTSFTIILVV